MALAQRAAVWLRRLAGRLAPRTARPDGAAAQTLQALRQAPALATMPHTALRQVAEGLHLRRYQAGELIYHEGDPGLGFYLVGRGRVRLLTGDDDAPREVGVVAEGTLLGTAALLGADVRREVSARAATDAVLLGFFRPDLATLTKRHPRAAAHLALALAAHLARERDAFLRDLAELSGSRADALRAALRPDAAPVPPPFSDSHTP